MGKYEVPIRSVINTSLQQLTEKGHNLSDMEPILVKYNLRGRTAGEALYEESTIRLNEYLLEKYGNVFINQTVVHEFAHLACYHLNNKSRLRPPHGEFWQEIMRQLGVPSNRTHSYETKKTERKKPYRYKCNCREIMFSQTRHSRNMKAKVGMGYRCLICHTDFKYIGL